MTPRGFRIVGAACVAAGVFDVAVVDAHLIQRFSPDEGAPSKVEVAMNTPSPSSPASVAPPVERATAAPLAVAGSAPPAIESAPPAVESAPPGIESAPALKLPLDTIRQFRVDAVMSGDTRSIATLGAWLRANPSASVVLEGHTDQRGELLYNERLSLRRARWVETQLILAGASPKQIKIVALGSTRPLAAGADEESFSQNRRVEVKLDDLSAKNARPR